MGKGKWILRRAAKAAAANVLHYTGLRRAIASARRLRCGGRRVLILSYHRVVEDFTGAVQTSIPGLLVSRETFRRQLLDLRASGYEFLSMSDALEVIAGRRRAQGDVCVVTFDDGYRDVYLNAFPVLKELGVPAVVYVPSGYVGSGRRFNHDRIYHLFRILQTRGFRPVYEALPAAAAGVVEPLLAGQLTAAAAVDAFLSEQPGGIALRLIEALGAQLGGGPELLPEGGEVMGWDELREMADAGIEVGAHTVSHTVLPLESQEQAEWEIRASKAQLEQQLGRPCVHFAYCNGWYSEELVRVLAQAGFRSAVTTEDLPNRVGGDPFTLKRKVLWENFSLGFDGTYSSRVTGCQLDDVFSTLGGGRVVLGRKPQRGPLGPLSPFTEPETLAGGR
jgi:peptidoglycan/xylan/chitin deacetylase (PgdA/CDA1 family)